MKTIGNKSKEDQFKKKFLTEFWSIIAVSITFCMGLVFFSAFCVKLVNYFLSKFV